MGKKVGIVGWYGRQNAGDEAFRSVFKTHLSQHELSFAEQPEEGRDLHIFGGGGVVVDQYLDNLPEQPRYALGVDIPLNGPGWERLLKADFKEIYCRSMEYSAIGKEQGLPVKYCPDLAFALDPRPELDKYSQWLFGAHAESQFKNKRYPRKRLAVLLTNELKEHMIEHVARSLRELQEAFDVVFISMYEGEGSDSEIIDRVKEKCFNPSYPALHINHTLDPRDLLTIISRMHLVISMRFHGSIFAAASGVPFLSLANKGKHSQFCEQEWVKDCFLELQELTAYKLSHAVYMLHEERASFWQKLRKTAAENRREVVETMNLIKRTWLA